MTGGLLLIGHGSRSTAGVDAYWQFASAVEAARPDLAVGCGFIELARPGLDEAADSLVERGCRSVVGVPLLLLGAGHQKNDGAAVLQAARIRHPGVSFTYGRPLGIHPGVLAVAEDRIRAAACPPDGSGDGADAVVLVGRGSSDPDANSDLYKVARLLAEGRGLPPIEPAFVSLAPPSVTQALDRCVRLGATRVAVVPYILFTGILVERIATEARDWAGANPGVAVAHGIELGTDRRLVDLVRERHDEAAGGGPVAMNCDCCVYRAPLPGHEHQVGRPVGHH